MVTAWAKMVDDVAVIGVDTHQLEFETNGTRVIVPGRKTIFVLLGLVMGGCVAHAVGFVHGPSLIPSTAGNTPHPATTGHNPAILPNRMPELAEQEAAGGGEAASS